MTKKLLKFLIVCGLAAVAGLVLYTQTNIGREMIDDALPPVRDDANLSWEIVGSGEVESMIESGVIDLLSGIDMGFSGELTETTLVMTGLIQTGANSGQDAAAPARMVTSVFQKRLEYYKASKKQLGIE